MAQTRLSVGTTTIILFAGMSAAGHGAGVEMRAIPYAILGITVIAVMALAAATAARATVAVQVFYVLVIAMLIAALVSSLVAAVALTVNRLAGYWRSGYPILLTALCLGFAALKATPTFPFIVVGVLLAVVGFVGGFKAPRSALRFVPLTILVFALALGEMTTVAASVRAAVFAVVAGFLLGVTWRQRVAPESGL